MTPTPAQHRVLEYARDNGPVRAWPGHIEPPAIWQSHNRGWLRFTDPLGSAISIHALTDAGRAALAALEGK